MWERRSMLENRSILEKRMLVCCQRSLVCQRISTSYTRNSNNYIYGIQLNIQPLINGIHKPNPANQKHNANQSYGLSS